MAIDIKPPTSAKTRAGRGRRRGSSSQLSKQDWINAAAILLAHKGVDAVRVEPLAVQLGVTKGSFYHHFKDRQALHQAILDDWRRRATRGVIRRLNDRSADPAERIQSLLRLPGRSPRSVEGANLELAIRLWAQSDDTARTVIDEVDQHRLDYLQSLFVELGTARSDAQTRAFLAYAATMGQAMFAKQDAADISDRVAAYLTKPSS